MWWNKNKNDPPAAHAVCEQCGALASIHVTVVSPTASEHHFCSQHVPLEHGDLLAKDTQRILLEREKVAKLVEAQIAECQNREMDPKEKASLLKMLTGFLALFRRR
jgi:hypothetical protein